MTEEYDCLTCDAHGTIEYVGFYQVGSEIICEFCYVLANKMQEDEE